MKVLRGLIRGILLFSGICWAQEEIIKDRSLPLTVEQELALLENKIKEIELQKSHHAQTKEALKKQLAIHNKRTLTCNNVRIKKIEKKLAKIASNNSIESKELISQLEAELKHLKADTTDLFCVLYPMK